MSASGIKVSSAYRIACTKAILSILFFLLVYAALIAFTIGLTVATGYLGITVMIAGAHWISLLIGAGIISVGLLVLIFIFKFIFRKQAKGEMNYKEIYKEDEPELFKFIYSIADQAGTGRPGKVFLSADVNAAVFYDNAFWSMFFPMKKNLLIGLGLVNTVSVAELKCILAHEFGHFSQKSMKVGSYVNNVNRIIYNMLYENHSFDDIIQSWGNIHAVIAVFVHIAVWIVRSIQSILKKVYELVNISYQTLSRQMEFHADAAAASIGGTKASVSSLCRVNFMEEAYGSVITYYSNRYESAVVSENIYPEQNFAIQLLAAERELPLRDGFLQVDVDDLKRFNKSELLVKDQWASHPAIEERVAAVQKLNYDIPDEDTRSAFVLFADAAVVQRSVTQRLFAASGYPEKTVTRTFEEFKKEYEEEYFKYTFDSYFNKYYDRKDPEIFTNEDEIKTDEDLSGDEFFGKDTLELLNHSLYLEQDLDSLRMIRDGIYKVKLFEYAGQKYRASGSAELIRELEMKLKAQQETIRRNDRKIWKYFSELAAAQGKAEELKELCDAFQEDKKTSAKKFELCDQLTNEFSFIHERTEYDQIAARLRIAKPVEQDFRNALRKACAELPAELFSSETNKVFDRFLSREWNYFLVPNYNEEALDAMFSAMNSYRFILSANSFRLKKNLLDFFARLKKNSKNLSAEQSLKMPDITGISGIDNPDVQGVNFNFGQ